MRIDGNFSMGRTTYGLTCLAVNLPSFHNAPDAAKRRNREAVVEQTHRLLALFAWPRDRPRRADADRQLRLTPTYEPPEKLFAPARILLDQSHDCTRSSRFGSPLVLSRALGRAEAGLRDHLSDLVVAAHHLCRATGGQGGDRRPA
jgi:hypothetical protein